MMYPLTFLLSIILTINLIPDKSESVYVHSFQSRTDTIRIDADSVYGKENRSPLDLKAGKYAVGDTSVDLNDFAFFSEKKLSSVISRNPDLTYLARVNVRGGSDEYMDLKGDTVVRFGKLRNKRAFKKTGYDDRREIGFRSQCPPMSCHYYYVLQYKKGAIHRVTTGDQLISIIKQVNIPADAFFLLDDDEYAEGRYAATKNGFYVLVNKRISDCRITYTDILYFVSKQGSVEELGRNVTQVTSLCF